LLIASINFSSLKALDVAVVADTLSVKAIDSVAEDEPLLPKVLDSFPALTVDEFDT